MIEVFEFILTILNNWQIPFTLNFATLNNNWNQKKIKITINYYNLIILFLNYFMPYHYLIFFCKEKLKRY